MKKSSIIFVCMIALVLFSAGIVMADNGFMRDFNSTYGTANTRLDNCSACHTSPPSLNSFGNDWRTLGFGTRLNNEDSDGDGFNNITEIDARFFPGDPQDFPVVANVQPTADTNGSYTGTEGIAVAFDGSGSSDPDGTIVSWDWDFGDGNTGTGEMPSHTYAAAGTYTVSLTVTDNDGETDTAETTAEIVSAPNQLVDIDIVRFSVTKGVRLGGKRAPVIKIKLVVVKNGGMVDSQTSSATVSGMQGDVEVHSETKIVSDAVDGRRTLIFQPYEAVATGDIVWTATVDDVDPDDDIASAVTTVK